MLGLGGALIVLDDPEIAPTELMALSCPTNCAADRVLVFQHVMGWGFDRYDDAVALRKVG